jgi:hypothetical protein
MRKFFQDYSASGVVLISFTLFLGFFFRLIALPEASAWGDEIASLFYANNLSEIFHHESHTPLYYFLCKIWMTVFGESIVALRYLFVLMSFSILSLSGFLLLKKKETGFFLLFVVVWWLWPTDIIFSRQARHYGLYAELSFFYLILWRHKNDYSFRTLYWSSILIQFLHPFILVPVWFLAFYDYLKKSLTSKLLLLHLTTSLPLIIYYLARFFTYGQEKVLSNISWIHAKTMDYIKGLVLLFGGDSYPLNQIYPLSFLTVGLFLFVVMIILLFKTKPRESWFKFGIIFLLSFLTIEIVSIFFTNVRISRYSFYLLPFFLYALIDSTSESRPRENLIRGAVLMVILCSYNLYILKPWSLFDWDDQNVASLKETLKNLPPRDLVVCGNRYQLDYYFKKPNLTCAQVTVSLLAQKKPFYFFDINGNDKVLMAYLLQEADLSFVKSIQHAIFIGVEPRR